MAFRPVYFGRDGSAPSALPRPKDAHLLDGGFQPPDRTRCKRLRRSRVRRTLVNLPGAFIIRLFRDPLFLSFSHRFYPQGEFLLNANQTFFSPCLHVLYTPFLISYRSTTSRSSCKLRTSFPMVFAESSQARFQHNGESSLDGVQRSFLV